MTSVLSSVSLRALQCKISDQPSSCFIHGWNSNFIRWREGKSRIETVSLSVAQAGLKS